MSLADRSLALSTGSRNRQRSNFELYAWLFMRISGVVLVFLVLGHLFIMNILDGGVQRINFAFVAGRWASPFWQVWDLAMLWLAMLHGTNGLRTIINDYAERNQTRFWPELTTAFQGNGPRIDLGLRLTWSDVGWGVIGGVAALMAGGAIALALTAVFGDFTSAAADVGEELRDEGPYLAVVAFALCVAIGAPIAEEIAFRGMAYNALAKRGLNTAWVIALTTVAFSLFHLEPVRAPILLASGLVLGVLRWRTRSLGAPIVAHAVNNLPGAAFLLLG